MLGLAVFSEAGTAGKLLLAVAALVVAVPALIILLGLLPRHEALTAVADPAAGYDAALARAVQIQEAEKGLVNDFGGSTLLDHGARMPRAYVLIHGVTNSPYQWAELGRALHAQGHNVLMLRMPYHGLQSRQVSELAALRVQDLRAYGDTAVDIAAGLGDEVIVAGISGGAVVGAWMAQNRPEISRVVLLAPFFGVHHVPPALSPLLRSTLSRLPNLVLHGAHETQRGWVYRGQATRGVAAFLALGQEVLRLAQEGPPPGGSIAVLTTAVDDTANNHATAVIVDLWRQDGVEVRQVEFPAEEAIPHNSVDPAADPAARSIVYAEMLRMFGEPAGALPS